MIRNVWEYWVAEMPSYKFYQYEYQNLSCTVASHERSEFRIWLHGFLLNNFLPTPKFWNLTGFALILFVLIH